MTEDKKQTSVWLPVNLYQWLRRKAFERNTSQSQVIEDALEAERRKEGRQ